MSAADLAAARRREALAEALGETVRAALADPGVLEVIANPDGRVIVDRLAGGRADTGARLTAGARERVIRLVADHGHAAAGPLHPRLSGVLPDGERFQGMLPPVCAAPAFCVRKRPAAIWTLADLAAQAVLTGRQAGRLRRAVAERRNILVCGGAGAGKTTFANALLAEPAIAADRVILIEDTPELQCAAWDQLGLLTGRPPAPAQAVDLVRDALRLRPDRIVIGELRDGATALEALKAWNTGHPGGVSTLHANSAAEALDRLEDLIAEVAASPPRRAIARAVDLIVHLERRGDRRGVAAMLAVSAAADDATAYRLVPA